MDPEHSMGKGCPDNIFSHQRFSQRALRTSIEKQLDLNQTRLLLSDLNALLLISKISCGSLKNSLMDEVLPDNIDLRLISFRHNLHDIRAFL